MEVNKELINSIKITPLIDTLQLEDISDDEYFSVKFKDYISNSRLGILKKDGVKAFFEGIKSEYNPSFETGTILHELTLEPELFELIEGVHKPTAKAGLMADYLYKEVLNNEGKFPSDDSIKAASYIIGYYKDKLTTNRLHEFKIKAEPYWRDRFIFETDNPWKEGDKNRIFTDEKNYELAINCLNALNNNPNIQELLHPKGITESPIVGNETTILMDVQMELENHEPRIYKLKAKLDNFSLDKEENILTVNDLKTTSRPVSIFDCTYYSYQREIAGYSWLLKYCAEKFYDMKNPTVKGNFLVVSTVPEYTTGVVPMTKELFKSGCVYYFNTIKGYEFS